MTRELTSAYLDELAASHVRIAFLYEGEFASSPLRLWTGLGDLVWDSKTFYGNGWFQGWAGGGESSDLKAISLDITLAGVPTSVVSLALSEAAQNKRGRLWLAFLDDSEQILADPYLLFEGKLDLCEITDAQEEATVVVSYETELVELEKAEEWRYTDQAQKTLFPGDRGLEYVTTVTDWDGFWGVPETKPKDRKKGKKPKKKGNKKRRR